MVAELSVIVLDVFKKSAGVPVLKSSVRSFVLIPVISAVLPVFKVITSVTLKVATELTVITICIDG